MINLGTCRKRQIICYDQPVKEGRASLTWGAGSLRQGEAKGNSFFLDKNSKFLIWLQYDPFFVQFYNVRQLENAISHGLILAQDDVIRRRHLRRFLKESSTTSGSTSLAENEPHPILRVLQEANWNKNNAARRLQVSRSTLYSKIRRYGLDKNWAGLFSYNRK